jgi:hypothetical protein
MIFDPAPYDLAMPRTSGLFQPRPCGIEGEIHLMSMRLTPLPPTPRLASQLPPLEVRPAGPDHGKQGHPGACLGFLNLRSNTCVYGVFAWSPHTTITDIGNAFHLATPALHAGDAQGHSTTNPGAQRELWQCGV